MIEMIGLVFFGFIVYTFLVIIPTMVEQVASVDFKNAYFRHLASRFINSYGR